MTTSINDVALYNSSSSEESLTSPSINGGTVAGAAISGGTISGAAISGGSVEGAGISGGSITGTPISGGSINGTPIGQTSAAAAQFTTPATSDNSQNAATTQFVRNLLDSYPPSATPIVLPGGLMIQFGSVSVDNASVSVTFGEAFPNACLWVGVTGNRSTGNGSLTTWNLSAMSTTGFTVSNDNNQAAWWIAVGY